MGVGCLCVYMTISFTNRDGGGTIRQFLCVSSFSFDREAAGEGCFAEISIIKTGKAGATERVPFRLKRKEKRC